MGVGSWWGVTTQKLLYSSKHEKAGLTLEKWVGRNPTTMEGAVVTPAKESAAWRGGGKGKKTV